MPPTLSTVVPPDPERIGRLLLRGLLPGYALLALLWLASAQVPRLNVLWLATCTLALALPMMMALWHQGTLRRLTALHQFQPGRGLHRWGSRRALGILWRAALAALLSAAVLLQSVFFGRLEWLHPQAGQGGWRLLLALVIAPGLGVQPSGAQPVWPGLAAGRSAPHPG